MMRQRVFNFNLEEISIEKKSVYVEDDADEKNYNTKSIEEEYNYHFSANISDKLKGSKTRTKDEVDGFN